MQARRSEREKEVRMLIEEERKMGSLSRIIEGIKGFIAESAEKRGVEGRIDALVSESVERLELVHKRSGDPEVRRAVRDAVAEMRRHQAVGLVELEGVYASTMPVEDKIHFFRDIEASVGDAVKSIMEGVKGRIQERAN